MADGFIQLNVGVGGDKVDVEKLTSGADTVTRSRIQVTGSSLLNIAAVINSAPSTEYGIVTRNIPSGTQNVAVVAGSSTIGIVDQGLGGTSAWKVDGSAVTQPISATSLPLPTGAATEATLALIKAKTDNLDVALSTRAVTGLTDAQLRATPVPVSAASWPLPTGAATEATLATLLTLAGFQARINTLGQKTSANSTPVVIASDQSALAITAASLPLPSGAATEATLATLLTTSAFQARINTLGQNTSANSTPVVLASDQSTLAVSAASLPLPTGAATEATLSAISGKLPAALVGGRLDSNVGAWLGSTAPTVGQKTAANSLPVVLASDQSLAVKSSTATLSNVTSSASSVTLLASNANRLGATIQNDSSKTLYVKLGTTASATDYTVKLTSDSYYEVPFGYTGRIDGIWAAVNGAARVTELT